VQAVDRFSAFSFVDRITVVEPGAQMRGQFAVPANVAHFSPCLVAEAIGQLAGWGAMAHTDFRRRPLAALAAEARMSSDVLPGEMVSLGVEFQGWDNDAVTYAGWARSGGRSLLTLTGCVGALLPLDQFETPDEVRERFHQLCGGGVPGGGFCGIATAEPIIVDHEPASALRATLQIPHSASFFTDHFPRRPVFPATLLLEAELTLASALARETAGPSPRLLAVTDVKSRTFILPGQTVDIDARVRSATADGVTVALAAHVAGRRVATARIHVGAEACA
jgi:3-hydroxymyristoyl/3-hydroxydecanoyl-(acyl carrier protein) dehydratase